MQYLNPLNESNYNMLKLFLYLKPFYFSVIHHLTLRCNSCPPTLKLIVSTCRWSIIIVSVIRIFTRPYSEVMFVSIRLVDIQRLIEIQCSLY